MTTLEEISSAALALPEPDRETLLVKIAASLGGRLDDELARTVQRRWDELASGKVKGIPLDEARLEIDRRLERSRLAR